MLIWPADAPGMTRPLEGAMWLEAGEGFGELVLSWRRSGWTEAIPPSSSRHCSSQVQAAAFGGQCIRCVVGSCMSWLRACFFMASARGSRRATAALERLAWAARNQPHSAECLASGNAP